MLLYVISAAVFAVVFLAGFVLIRKNPTWIEKAVIQLSLVGFFIQIAINWLFLGKGMVYNPFVENTTLTQTSVHFLILCLISIFCYCSLMMILYKAHEFYNE